jgi:hypothetical protein
LREKVARCVFSIEPDEGFYPSPYSLPLTLLVIPANASDPAWISLSLPLVGRDV